MKVIVDMTEEKETTTTITISKTNHRRLESILRHGENFDFAVTLCLLMFAKPNFNRGGALGNRVVLPQFTEEEIEEIRKAL